MTSKLLLTFGIIKPHVVKNPVALQSVHDIILSNKFYVIRSRITQVALAEAEQFYAEHRNKFFYDRLITFMTSGPSQVMILARQGNAMQKWRDIMGPTKVYKTIFSHPDSIRGKWGLSDTRNATHGADAPESVEREVKIFFPDFSFDSFYKHDENHYRNDNVDFDCNKFVHSVKDRSK